MLVHTKTRRTKVAQTHREENAFVTANEFFEDVFGDRPRGSVYLAGSRNKEGLTQKELGEKIGVSQYNISKMETGHRPIGKNIAQRFAKIFKTDYRLFL